MTKRVLVVEDDQDIQDYYRVILSELGLELIWANNGKEALEIIDQDQTFDLIILDIVMPVMGGEKFLLELRKVRKIDMPVILSTVDDVSADRLEKITKVQGSFFKLAKVEELQALVKKVLGI